MWYHFLSLLVNFCFRLIQCSVRLDFLFPSTIWLFLFKFFCVYTQLLIQHVNSNNFKAFFGLTDCSSPKQRLHFWWCALIFECHFDSLKIVSIKLRTMPVFFSACIFLSAWYWYLVFETLTSAGVRLSVNKDNAVVFRRKCHFPPNSFMGKSLR